MWKLFLSLTILTAILFTIKVNAATPIYGYVSFTENLKNGSSKAMNVNGSSVNQAFSYAPISGQVAITGISIILQDDGATNLNKFGAITALTNGISIGVTIASTGKSITTIKDNSDLFTRFEISQIGSSAVLSILSVITPLGFGDTVDSFQGFMGFNPPIILDQANSDAIGAVVRDNLTNIDMLEMAVKGYNL